MNRIFIVTILAGMTFSGMAEEQLVPTSGVMPYEAKPSKGNTSSGVVARAMFTTGMNNREPVDRVIQLGTDTRKVFYFTELKGFGGKTVYHRWEYQGKVMSEVGFKVGGQRWRVFSSKQLDPGWTGDWTVVVTDEEGWPIKASVMTYADATVSDGTPGTSSAEALVVKY